MRKIVLILFLLTGMGLSKAQTHELGVFLGGSNYVGDIGATNHINPNQLAFGVLYKWNKSSRYSWRASFTVSDIVGDDADSDIRARNQRGFEFRNTVRELSVGLEFNFLEFNLHNFSKPITPYLYGGLSYFNSSELFFDNGVAIGNGNRNTFAIPMTLGIKGKLGQRIIIGAEVGARYTFTDNLDGSNPRDAATTQFRFGGLNTDDWYVFSGITITYTFGKKPCYYCFE
ncbi:hypothetical protein GWK08_03935 [Leptobacterium flavescens]|uniref:DUF6089 domain-containing protein n=1 Tax=Leptobacterium flavescens TaxID=472055 RepID=A0A6P0UL26_9FLAO|nr:DUF6089 family protein [Leptobacterium flavescens]NER12579.1 hypothetical protein [Leptobacterium flavescens]